MRKMTNSQRAEREVELEGAFRETLAAIEAAQLSGIITEAVLDMVKWARRACSLGRHGWLSYLADHAGNLAAKGWDEDGDWLVVKGIALGLRAAAG